MMTLIMMTMVMMTLIMIYNDDTGKNENEKNYLELLEAAREAASLTAKGSIQVNHLFKGKVKKAGNGSSESHF